MKVFLICSIVCCYALFILAPLGAETIPRDVVGGGGGKSTNADYQLLHTVGQPVINVVSGSGNIHEQGFWYLPWFYVTGVEDEALMPVPYRLDQNYPNPFNPVTTIRFALRKPSRVTLRVYDALGRLVTRVVDEEMDAGEHKVPFNARGIASGVYFYRIRAAEFEKTRKMIILR